MADAPTVINFDMPARGVCTECGNPAYHHMATKCDDHRPPKGGKSSTPRTQDDTPIKIVRPDTAPSTGGGTKIVKPDKGARAAELERSILVDLNPQIVQGFAMLCRPVAPENFYTLDNGTLRLTELGASVVIPDGQAKILGKAAAELEGSQIGTAAAAFVGPMMPILYGVAALGIVVFHTYKVMQVRQSLMLQVQQSQQEQAMNQAGQAPPSQVSEDTPFIVADVRGMGSTKPTNGQRRQESPQDFTAA